MSHISKIEASSELPKLNSLRLIIVLMIAFGYASTMPVGPVNSSGGPNPEWLKQFGYDPSWIGISLLFFLSGLLAMRSLFRHGSSIKYLESRFFRNAPLLFFVTLIIVLVIYPVFGSPQGPPMQTLKNVILYFMGTVTCIRPGEPLPGLLDDAKYMCLIQGSIWTLKWGVLAHIAVAIGQRIKLFANRSLLLSLALFSIIFYVTIVYFHIGIHPMPGDIIIAAQLGWPFLTGMAIYAYWDKVPSSFLTNFLISAGLMAVAAGQYYLDFIPWTKAIVVCLILSWAWICIGFLKLAPAKLRFMNKCPAMALAVYLINWPVSQILLLIFPEITPGQLILFSLPVTLVLSSMAHKIVSERSFRYAKNREVLITA